MLSGIVGSLEVTTDGRYGTVRYAMDLYREYYYRACTMSVSHESIVDDAEVHLLSPSFPRRLFNKRP